MRFLTAAFLINAVCLTSLFAPAAIGQKVPIGNKRTTPATKILNPLEALANASPESSQSGITGPAGSGQFGATVAVLPNGNIVIADPGFDGGNADIGAVYLYNGATLALISTLTGSIANDQVGGGGITILSNGNYVVRSPNWDNGGTSNAGAVTFGNAATGVSGIVSAGNSIIGDVANDLVGSGGVTALTNGNYVVSSPNWGVTDFGAATWGNGAGGSAGTVSTGVSIVGSTLSDLVSGGGVVALTNGNYVVKSPNWHANDLGAATWGNGAVGTSVTVGAGNSLVGGFVGDSVSSSGVTPLTNGNYVVSSPMANASDFGAATWGNGSVGTSGTVSAANSLTGTIPGDTVGVGGVVALTNGNYVVRSPGWDNGGGATDAGAATFALGTGATVATVSPVNSLVGSTTNDNVSGAGVVALTNGNYVVQSPAWDNGGTADVGAATFGSGTTGISGLVSAANSLIGSTASDFISLGGVAALSNGNYVVGSPNWNNGATVDVGAATFGNGTTGISGAVTTANSLHGLTANDNVGGVTALANGNYVVNSPNWDNGGTVNAGAVTLGNGAAGTTGPVTIGNSLYGSTLNDNIGTGVIPLSNGNYVVRSPSWDNTAPAVTNAGAVTWGNGTAGVTGVVSSSNSLSGSTANDQVGSGGVIALTNGNYTVRSPNWDNGAIVNAGAVTYGAGNGGTAGPIAAGNSVLGTVSGGTVAPALPPAAPISLERLVVGRPSSNTVTILDPTYTAVSNGNWSAAATWDYGAFIQPHDVIIPGSRTVTLDVNIPAGGTLLIEAGGTLSLSGNRSSGIPITNDGTINLAGGKLDMGANLLSVGCTGTFSGANTNSYVIGTVQKQFCSTGTFSFPIGTANGFSAVDANITALGINPSSLTINATQTVHPNLHSSTSLKRYWTITEVGDVTADLVFHYNDPLDIGGVESSYKLFRVVGGVPNIVPGFVLNPIANTMSINGVTAFSDWAIGNVAPTAGEVTISGRVVSLKGAGMPGVSVTLTDAVTGDRRTTITDSSGAFTFADVPSGKSYILSAALKGYNFDPKVIQVDEDIDGITLVAKATAKRNR